MLSPSWLPLCKAMQRYCEPYFEAVNRWCQYKQIDLIRNRIQLIETICQMSRKFVESPDQHRVELIYEVENVELLPEVIPSAGKSFYVGGDQTAFERAKEKFDSNLFQRGGVYFQSNLLKALAGWSAEVLAASNLQTRKNIIDTVEKLLRIPEEAGVARLVYSVDRLGETVVIDNANGKDNFQSYKTVELQDKAKEFYDFIVKFRDELSFSMSNDKTVIESKAQSPAPSSQTKSVRSGSKNGKTPQKSATKTPPPELKQPSSSKRKSSGNQTRSRKRNSNSRSKSKLKNSRSEEIELIDTEWTVDHPSVGSNVAAFFPEINVTSFRDPEKLSKALKDPEISRVYVGTVSRYAPPSSNDVEDQLYHIVWEDGDEADYEEIEYQAGKDLYPSRMEWTTNHKLVGCHVAAYFPDEDGNKTILYRGIVSRYALPNETDSEWFHIFWEDGDQQDVDFGEVNECMELFDRVFSNRGKRKKSTSSRSHAKDTTTRITLKRMAADDSLLESEQKDSNVDPNPISEETKIEDQPQPAVVSPEPVTVADDHPMDSEVLPIQSEVSVVTAAAKEEVMVISDDSDVIHHPIMVSDEPVQQIQDQVEENVVTNPIDGVVEVEGEDQSEPLPLIKKARTELETPSQEGVFNLNSSLQMEDE